MPLPVSVEIEMAVRHDAAARAAKRDLQRDLVRAGLECLGWGALGLLAIGWGVQCTDSTLGTAAVWVGVGVGNGGWLAAVLGVYRRGEARGDW